MAHSLRQRSHRDAASAVFAEGPAEVVLLVTV